MGRPHEGTGPAGGGLAGRLQAARERSFVGRRAERDLFRAALDADPPPFAVLHLHGPGGIGKSALLQRFVHEARAAGHPVVVLDGRELDPSPDGFRAALGAALGVPADEAIGALAGQPHPVLLLDTHELLAPLDGWLRTRLVPRLPVDALVVLAGRQPPTAGWREDPAWSELLRVVALRDLPADDARGLLEARGVPPRLHDDALRVARGHPLALVLLAEVLADGRDDPPADLADTPTVIEGLLDRVLRHVPGPDHRRALHAAAHVGVATEALVRDVVEVAAAEEVFGWLRGLAFTAPVADGLAVHDLVGDALNADLQWRDPEGFVALHEVVTRHLEGRVAGTAGVDQQRAMLDLVRLYRFHPVTRRFFDWDGTAQLWLEPARPTDHEAIRAMTRQHEGAATAEIAAYWLDHQPEAFTVFRGAETDAPAGFVAHLLLGDRPGPEVEADPVAAAAWDHVRATAPPRPGERLRLLRFWIARDAHQDIATHHLVSVRSALDWTGTDRLAWSVVVLSDPDFYEPIFRFIDFDRPPDRQVTVGDHTVGLFTRDWRVTSRRAWRELLRDRRTRPSGPLAPPPDAPERRLVLAHDDFVEAVRDALRGLARPGGLDGNPLLRSRVVADADGDPGEALARLLDEAADELSSHPRDRRAWRALDLTYFRPAPTQEAAAERLDLPFSTFRRHLASGVDHVAAWMWQRETHGARPAP